jgi:hypothetical protein
MNGRRWSINKSCGYSDMEDLCFNPAYYLVIQHAREIIGFTYE